MNECGCPLEEQTGEKRHVLTLALILNATMFVVGLVGGILAQSTGLIADSLDMLADASAYTIALFAISRSSTFKARAATLSGTILLVLGIGVLGDVLRRGLMGSNPETTMMLIVASASLVVNSTVLYLLGRYRAGEVHLRATWIFTRVDVIANIGVILAAVIVRLSKLEWVDLIVGAAIGIYIVKEAFEIIASARSARD